MVKESNATVSKSKSVNSKKKLALKKKSSKSAVKKEASKTNSKEATKTSVKKETTVVKEASPKPVRKFNKRPVLAKTTGINISPAKVKNIVSNHVLNRDAHAALSELKKSFPMGNTIFSIFLFDVSSINSSIH